MKTKCMYQSPFLTVVRIGLWFLQPWGLWGSLLSCLPFGAWAQLPPTLCWESQTGNFKERPMTSLLHI